MDMKTRKEILKLAIRAPSSDNSQPFYFHWEGDKLHIFHDEERALRRGNNANTASLLALGCLLESITIAASGQDARFDYCLTFEDEPETGPWVSAELTADRRPADELLPGLAIRCSDRRLYQGGSLSDPVFEAVRADMTQFEGCHLYFQEQPGESFLTYLGQCETFLWDDPKAIPDVFKWVRWSDQEAKETRDGVHWRGLAIPFAISRLMKLAYKSERFRSFLRKTGAPLKSQRRVGREQIDSSAAVGCFTAVQVQPRLLVTIGRAFLRTWVRLNMAGYGLQVMALPSLHVFQHVTGVIPDDYPDTSKKVFTGGKAILQSNFGIPADETPAWMFRTGKSTPLPDDWRTYRLPLANVVQDN